MACIGWARCRVGYSRNCPDLRGGLPRGRASTTVLFGRYGISDAQFHPPSPAGWAGRRCGRRGPARSRTGARRRRRTSRCSALWVGDTAVSVGRIVIGVNVKAVELAGRDVRVRPEFGVDTRRIRDRCETSPCRRLDRRDPAVSLGIGPGAHRPESRRRISRSRPRSMMLWPTRVSSGSSRYTPRRLDFDSSTDANFDHWLGLSRNYVSPCRTSAAVRISAGPSRRSPSPWPRRTPAGRCASSHHRRHTAIDVQHLSIDEVRGR